MTTRVLVRDIMNSLVIYVSPQHNIKDIATNAVNGQIFCNSMKELLCAKSVGARQLVRLKPIFLADAMLGNVARKLRIFGFDTLYIKDIHDDDVLKIGIAQKRIILTC